MTAPNPLPGPDYAPLVFLSYSWDSDEHCAWVLALATELCQRGVDIILDRWHLHLGADKNRFMENSAAESDYVLLVCTPNYAAKANERRGGVGYEHTVITGELAEDLATEKFIPVLRSGEWKDALPRWVKSRVGPDLRGDLLSESQFLDLLRTLHQQPLQPPPRGQRPVFDPVNPPALRFAPPTAASAALPATNGRVPFELPPPAEAFFGRQPELAKLTERLRARRNTAVVADAGFGKTALAAQAIRAITGETREALAASPYRTALSSSISMLLRASPTGRGTSSHAG